MKYRGRVTEQKIIPAKGAHPEKLVLIVKNRGMTQAIPMRSAAVGEFFPVGAHVEIRVGADGCRVTRISDA